MCIATIGSETRAEERYANARLIAAAPDLLDAAQNALAFLKCIDWNTDHDADDAENVRFLLDAAITKAEGVK
jgi:hypothetical protein